MRYFLFIILIFFFFFCKKEKKKRKKKIWFWSLRFFRFNIVFVTVLYLVKNVPRTPPYNEWRRSLRARRLLYFVPSSRFCRYAELFLGKGNLSRGHLLNEEARNYSKIYFFYMSHPKMRNLTNRFRGRESEWCLSRVLPFEKTPIKKENTALYNFFLSSFLFFFFWEKRSVDLFLPLKKKKKKGR